MSPSSVSTGRLVKPHQYAGIPHLWRIEPAEPVLLTYGLDDGAYRELERFDDEVLVDEPSGCGSGWPTCCPDDLLSAGRASPGAW